MFNLWSSKLYRKWMYRKIDNSVIYEVVRKPGIVSPITLYGPIENDTIKYANPKYSRNHTYCQVIGGKMVSLFREHELLFLDKKI